MRFPVPQFIDIEDTIVGPFTAKQSLYLGTACMVAFLASMIFNLGVAALIGLIALGVGIAFSFYKPNGRPLTVYMTNIFLFSTKPNLYLWRRDPEGLVIKRAIKKEPMGKGRNVERKIVTRSRLLELAWMIDTRQSLDVEGEEERE